jgi:hypothetical protein
MLQAGLAQRVGTRFDFAQILLDTLRREQPAAAEPVAAETGLPFRAAAVGIEVLQIFPRIH